MKLRQIVESLGLSVRSGEGQLDREVTGGYVGDLLSDVIANSKAGQIWITMQVHANVVAVAVQKDLAAIVIVQGRQPDEAIVRKARESRVAIILSPLSAFETTARIHGLVSSGG